MDNFDRAAENPLSDGGKWVTSGGTQGFSTLKSSGSGAVAPSSPSGSSWATKFSLPIEEYVDLSEGPDSSGVWLQFLDSPTSSAVNGDEVGFFSGHYEVWGGEGANTLLKYASTTISAGDTVGYSVDTTGLITIWRKHSGVWEILGSATDAQHISDGWLDVTADAGQSLDNFGGGTPVTAPVNSDAPAVTGSTVQGGTLATTNGTWTNSPTSYSYQWQDCDALGASCANLVGATAPSYTVAASDAGNTIRSVVTATNSAGSTSASSLPTTVVVPPPPPTNVSLPTISGTPRLGQTLSANNGQWTGGPTSYTYQWQDCSTSCSIIPGATGQTYTLQADDFGQEIDVIVTATNAGGSTRATSAQLGPVAVAPPGSCGPAPGTSQTLGGTTYYREGVDDFTKDAPVGSFAESQPGQVVYTGDGGMGWTEYPDGWGTPATGATEAYQPSTVQSVHDGVLDYYLHNDSHGNPVAADPSPLPGGNRYQAYGAYSVCEKVVPDPGSDLNDFHQAYTIFPQDEALWADGGESDYPEFGLGGGGTPSFFLHWGGPNGSGNSVDQDIGSIPAPFDPTEWHVYTQEWKPDGTRAYYIDGKLVGTSTSSPFSQPERWQLQIEPTGTVNDGGHGHVYVDWAWIGSPAPTISHVVFLLMENRDYSQVIGNSSAPYINSLASTYGLATNYFATAHPSLPNYIALTSGSTQGITDDDPPFSHQLAAPSIFSQLPNGGSRSLEESMSASCLQSNSDEYVVHHNPEAYYVSLGADCSNFDVAFGSVPDLSARFTFITPNLINDMHDGTVAQGDAFLQSYVPQLMATPQYHAGNTAIFIVWDEDAELANGNNNHVPLIVVSPYTHGVSDGTRYDHYSLLREAETLLELPLLGNAKTASSMAGRFGF